MRVLFLTSEITPTTLPTFLASAGHEVTREHEPVTDLSGFDAVVSFGYRHLLRKPALASAKRPPLNLHISYLPYNRGAHPVFWALYDGTPVGVTIHEIDEGVDTGPICFQRELERLELGSTFRSAHAAVIEGIEALFRDNADALLSGNYTTTPQAHLVGTKHKMADLPEGFSWDDAYYATLRRLRDTKQANEIYAEELAATVDFENKIGEETRLSASASSARS